MTTSERAKVKELRELLMRLQVETSAAITKLYLLKEQANEREQPLLNEAFDRTVKAKTVLYDTVGLLDTTLYEH